MLKRLIRRTFRAFGFDLRYFDPLACEDARLMKTLSERSVNLVFDVGANTGQFGRFLRNAGCCNAMRRSIECEQHCQLDTQEPKTLNLRLAVTKMLHRRRRDTLDLTYV